MYKSFQSMNTQSSLWWSYCIGLSFLACTEPYGLDEDFPERPIMIDIAGSDLAGESAGDVAGDVAGEAAGEEAPVIEYNFVVVKDTSDDTNPDGTPGVDICDIAVTCDGEAVFQVEGIFIFRGSPVCDGSNNDNCLCRYEVPGQCGGVDRSEEYRVFDENVSCENDDWTSLGINGSIALNFDIHSCTEVNVTVTEKVSPEYESFIVALCRSADVFASNTMSGDDCIELGGYTGGGVAEFSWTNPF